MVAWLTAGVALAVLASATALVALAVHTGIHDAIPVVLGTLMFALIYVGVGATVGSLVHNPVNGTVIVLFVWILDVFFGPAMGASDRLVTRGLPTHYVTLWMVDLTTGHSGQLDNLRLALAWTAAALLAACTVAAARTRTRRLSPLWHCAPGSGWPQVGAAFRAAWRDARRNPAQWILFVVLPVVFILTARQSPPTSRSASPSRKRAAAWCVPSRCRPRMERPWRRWRSPRLQRWLGCSWCSTAATATSVPLLPFLDVGIAESPMLNSSPTALSQLLPGYGGSRVLLDSALTRGFDETVAGRAALAGVPRYGRWVSPTDTRSGRGDPPCTTCRPTSREGRTMKGQTTVLEVGGLSAGQPLVEKGRQHQL